MASKPITGFTLVRLIALRELRERVRAKAFLVSTAFSLLLILAGSILPGLLKDDGPTTYDIGVFGDQAEQLATALPSGAKVVGSDVAVDVRRLADAEEGRRLVKAGTLDAAVGDGYVVVNKDLGVVLGTVVRSANRQTNIERALAKTGLTPEAAEPLLLPPLLDVRPLDPISDAQDTRQGLVFIGTILLYVQLLGFGYWVASGVVEEKASRVVEILLAKVSATQLLAGKVIGIGLLGLAQLVGFVVIGLVAAGAAGSVKLPPETISVAVQVIGWFVLGFAFYSSLFAVGGALASRVEELQSTTTPITLVAMVSFFTAIGAGSDPSGTVARVATFLPPCAPLVLPVRIAAGEISPAEVAVSVALVLISIVAVMALAARVYANGSLHLRGQLKLRNALGARHDRDRADPT